ncbi:L,D-transpeptidase [Candidatus Methylocalor cossyra]|uniref:Lipoprotein-anchoring transpeptidase ErfK/SrfK n=1 Tax=Candidatus Methylocalor cossyra TaxID=3108543 RepID=A0ABP1CC10_9GAMM
MKRPARPLVQLGWIRRPPALAAALAVGAWLTLGAWRALAPFGVAMPDWDGQVAVDPRAAVEVTALGWGTRLTQAELRDETGKVLPGNLTESRYRFLGGLEFGTRYTLTVTAERPWFGQRETRLMAFSTVAVPKLEGSPLRTLAPDASLSLRFDRPVGQLKAKGDLELAVTADPDRQTFRLQATRYPQGRTLPVDIAWETPTGIPLPPLRLQLTTPPPLTVELNTDGLSNLGLAMPLQFTFSEPLLERAGVSRHIAVRSQDGRDITGRWQWINKRRLQFTPQPGWPATSTVEVRIDPAGLKAQSGGMLEQPVLSRFSTGPDRRIVVYLDTQKAAALENGQVVRTFPVSTGKPDTPTITGSFYIYARFPVKTMRSRAKPGEKGHYVVEDVPYAQYFYEDYAFHGAWWHNSFGRPASHGCINLSTRKNNRRWPNSAEDAGWLYRWASLGVPVSVVPRSPAPTQMAANEARPNPKPEPAANR